MKLPSLITGILFLSMSYCCTAQHIETKYIEFYGNKVVVHYDLIDSIEGRYYTIRLYSSADGFISALEKVTGDVGLEVKPGKNRKIEWEADKEFGASYEGKVSLEIRGRAFIPFVNAEAINGYKVFKRKRKYNLTWTGGTLQNVLNFDLLRDGKKVMTFPNIANVGHHNFEFPGYVRPGKGYTFKISDSKNSDDVVHTRPFKIKRKWPLVLKIIPVIAAGAVVYTLVSGSANNDQESPIPDPLPPNK